MRRQATDRRRFWPDIPFSHCPGKDYYWDGDNKKWIHIEDDDDMSWLRDAALGKDANPNKKVMSPDDEMSGKTWKAMMSFNAGDKSWQEVQEELEGKGLIKKVTNERFERV